MPAPPSAASERLRTIRRRVTVGAVATFVAAWLAVAAFGKTGKTSASGTPTPQSSAPQGSLDGSGGYDDGSGAPYDDGSSGYDDRFGDSQGDQSGPQDDQSGSRSGQSGPAPLTTQQS
jgi:hypothetical protein